MKRLFFPVVAMLVASPLAAQELPGDTARTHVVRPGDTLWDLSEQYLSNPFRWPEIYGANRSVVADPHWIYPAQRLRIPGRGGSSPVVAAAPADGYVPAAPALPPARTVFFPQSPSANAGALVSAAGRQDVPVVTPGDFYRAGRLVPDGTMEPLGRLVEVAEVSAVKLRETRQIHPHTRVYLKLEPGTSVQVGDELHLWRPGREIRPYGRIHEPTGTARVVAVDGDLATVSVERLFAPVLLGDLALPVEQFAVPGGVIPRPAAGLEGRVVAFATRQAVASVEDIAYLDVGASSGVVEGDVFVAVTPPRRTEYGIRPEIEVARLQVVRVSDRTSAARVTSLQQPALEAGQVVRLVGKMP